MKLAEALLLRADHQKRLAQLEARLTRNAMVQEGDHPAEDPPRLLDEFEEAAAALERLIRRINHTNLATRLDGATTVTDALARRDVLKLRQTMFTRLAAAATVTRDRHGKSEIKFQGTVSVPEVQARADTLAKELRELDARIQEVNWRTELIEADNQA